MLYRFKSPVDADVVMLEIHARQLLRIMGKDDQATQGIVTAPQIPAAVAALQAAIEQQTPAASEDGTAADDEDEAPQSVVSLGQRALPLLHMLRNAQESGQAVIWGV